MFPNYDANGQALKDLRSESRQANLGSMDLHWHVGDVVRKLRLKRDLTQKQLAKLAQVHHNTIVRLEDADEGIQGRTLTKVATALEISPKELWSLVPEMTSSRAESKKEPLRAQQDPPATDSFHRPASAKKR